MVGCRMHFFDVVQAIALDFASWRRACRLIPSQTASARSSMDRASDYGSEGWGFESLRARSGPPRCDPPVGVLHFWTAPLRGAFPLPARRLPSCPACSVLPRSTPVRCHIPRRWAGWRSGLVDASDAEVIHVGETGSALAFRNCPSSGVCPAAGVVWVSAGGAG